MLSDRHQWLRLAWCLPRGGLNLRTLVGREPVSVSCNRWSNGSLEIAKYGVYPKEHPTNSPLRWRLLWYGVYLSWLQAGLGHHTRKPNTWSVHQRCLTTSCSPFRQSPTSCVYGWQRQAASFKGSNRLPSKWSRDFSSIASHEPGFESDIACLGHARLLGTGSWASFTNLTSIGSIIASGMATATTAAYPTTDWRVEVINQARGGNTQYWTLNHRCR